MDETPKHDSQRNAFADRTYRELFDNGPDGIVAQHLNADGSPGPIIEVNSAICRMLGYSREEMLMLSQRDLDTPVSADALQAALTELRSTGRAHIQIEILRKDGTALPVEVHATFTTLGNDTVMYSFIHDITERKRAEDRELLVRKVLTLLNRSEDTVDAIRSILLLVKKQTCIEAVGIRLNEGDDFPYFTTDGFPEPFVCAERFLCEHNEAGEIVRDGGGSPALECMCGNIIRGRTDPSLPFFTEGGSFWSNCTTDLLATTTEKERQARTRDRCNSEGYESVALIPLRSGDDIIGLLQLNDRRRGQFTAEMIRFFEGLGASIGLAFHRAQSQKALRESEAKYAAVVDGSNDLIAIVQDGMLQFASRKMPETFGWTLDEIVEKPFSQFISPEFRELVSDRYKRRLSGEDVPPQYEMAILSKDGVSIPVEVSVSVISYEGRPADLLIVRDITERKRAEEALHQYAHIVSSSSDMLALLGTDFVYRAANNAYAEAFEKTRDEIVGHAVSEVFGEDFFREVIKPNAERCLNGEEVRYREWFEFGHGRRFMEITYYPHVAESGDVEGFVVNGRDITDQKLAEDEKSALEEQLHESQKMEAIGTLAGGIAHDFNNLLTCILGYSSLLKRDVEEGTKVYEAYDIIEKAALRAAELTQQLLGFARRGKLLNAPVDMHVVIGDTIAILGRTIDKRIAITQQLAAERPMVKGDISQLQQVVMNIAINAGQAMSDGGAIVFETAVVELDEEYCRSHSEASAGVHLMVSISDTGTGIPDDVLPRIFDPFYTTKEVGKGTGLGLAMVYGIVKNHGGHIAVETKIGQGSTFKVYLPLEETRSPKTDSGEYKVAQQLHGRILVVDDEEVVREVAAAILTSFGCEVTSVNDGKEAVDYYEAHLADVDLVVLDLTMPTMSGRDCFYALKRLDTNVKVIIATGHALDSTGQELLDAGALRFVPKPFMPEDLAEAVGKALKV